MQLSRRRFMAACVAAGCAGSLTMRSSGKAADAMEKRQYNLSVSPEALEADPELLDLAKAAGVSDVWISGFLYGHWYFTVDTIQKWRRRAEEGGLNAHVINVPLGHPGDALGAMSGAVPLTPPRHWRLGVRPDATTFAGTSLHPPATEENADALKKLQAAGVRRVFLDDDFRLARSPGSIGGCFCDAHKRDFLAKHGYDERQWSELIDAVNKRALTPMLRAWTDFTCDQLTTSFRAQQAATPDIELGNMVMYLGAEKAGIRLRDYANAPIRVGELMFDDKSFAPIKGKTDELFSSLFHRRYASPERAYSETTAYPSDKLSAKNMAAKLAVSTISDVRNTMFMSGITCFPRTHWETLGPAMKKHRSIHEIIAGHAPKGPFKHYWGDYDRMAGEDKPNSLFLASGVPFETVDRSDGPGWTFVSHSPLTDEPASKESSSALLCREFAGGAPPPGVRVVPEALAALFALKTEIRATLKDVPFVEGDQPVVCAWYPTADAILLWNLSEEPKSFSVRYRDALREVKVGGLDVELLRLA